METKIDFRDMDLLDTIEKTKVFELGYEHIENIKFVEVNTNEYPIATVEDIKPGYEFLDFVKKVGKKTLDLLKKLLDMMVKGIKKLWSFLKKVFKKLTMSPDEKLKEIIAEIKKDPTNINNYKIEKLAEGPVALPQNLEIELRSILPILYFNNTRLNGTNQFSDFALLVNSLLSSFDSIRNVVKWLSKTNLKDIEKSINVIIKNKKSGLSIGSILNDLEEEFPNTVDVVRKIAANDSDTLTVPDNLLFGRLKNNVENFIRNYRFGSSIRPLFVFNLKVLNNDVVVSVEVVTGLDTIIDFPDIVNKLANNSFIQNLKISSVTDTVERLNRVKLKNVDIYILEPNDNTANLLLSWDKYLNAMTDDKIIDEFTNFMEKYSDVMKKEIDLIKKELDEGNDYFNLALACMKLDVETYLDQLKEFNNLLNFGTSKFSLLINKYLEESVKIWVKK